MNISGEKKIVLLYVLTDLLLYWVALTMVPLTRLQTVYQVDFTLFLRDRLICSLFFVSAMVLAGCYTNNRLIDSFDSVYLAWAALLAVTVAEFAILSLLPSDLERAISRREILIAALIVGLMLTLWHHFAARLVARFPQMRRFFYVLGDKKDAERIVNEIKGARTPLGDAEFCTFGDFVKKHEGSDKDLDAGSRRRGRVIITSGGGHEPDLTEMLAFCELHCEQIFLYPSIEETLLFPHSNLSSIAGIPLVEVPNAPGLPQYLFVKRLADVLCATLGLLAAFPLCILTAIAIKLNSPGPVFFTQERLTRGGKPFKIVKFRSMVVPSVTENDQIRAEREDARITPLGGLIRKYKIDEIPQLLNVLNGDMSLVGPRPLWREFFQDHPQSARIWERRLAVRPGVTSLSHVLGSSYSDPRDFLRYDFIYINNISAFTDLKILFATVRIVLGGKGSG